MSDIGQKGHFLWKKGTTNFTTPYLNQFLSVLDENKALYNFHKRGQGLARVCVELIYNKLGFFKAVKLIMVIAIIIFIIYVVYTIVYISTFVDF